METGNIDKFSQYQLSVVISASVLSHVEKVNF